MICAPKCVICAQRGILYLVNSAFIKAFAKSLVRQFFAWRVSADRLKKKTATWSVIPVAVLVLDSRWWVYGTATLARLEAELSMPLESTVVT